MHSPENFPCILLLCSDAADRAVIKNAIHLHHPEALFCVAKNEAELLERLHWLHYSLIIADYQFSNHLGLKAFLWAQVKSPGIPFIFVTDEMIIRKPSSQSLLPYATARISRDQLLRIGYLVNEILYEFADHLQHVAAKHAQQYRERIRQQKLGVLLSQAINPLPLNDFVRIYHELHTSQPTVDARSL